MSADLYCMLYHSQLAPNAPVSCISEIIKTARAFNAAHGVTGILVFDGQRFLQHLEGPEQILTDLIVRIAQDPRHIDFTLQHHGASVGPRRFPNWSMAYADIDGGDPLADGHQLTGQAAMTHFNDLVPSLDIA